MPRIASSYTVEKKGIGLPDYTSPAPVGQIPIGAVYTLTDMAELAARLGSIVTFDRRGNVMFLEDFEGNLSKCRTDASAGGSVSISSKYARGGSFSCKLVTGPIAGDFAYLGIPLAYPVLSKMGFEVCWNRSDGDALDEIDILFELYDGKDWWWPEVRWVRATFTWEYRKNAVTWVALSPAVNYYMDNLPFNHAKLVVDFVNKEYVRFIANNIVYDLAGIGLYSMGAVVPGRIVPSVTTYTAVAASAVNYIDSIIITQNEPIGG